MDTCLNCKAPFAARTGSGRRRRYCSAACKQQAYRRRSFRNTIPTLRNTPLPGPVLKYPGSKWRRAAWITSHLPPADIYLEPFFGSGAIFLQLPWQPTLSVLNDLDGQLVNLFQVIRDHTDELADRIRLTPWARAEYESSYHATDDPIEAARRFLVRCWQAHSTKTSHSTGWRNVGPRNDGATTTLWTQLPLRIRAIVDRLRSAEIECRPAIEIIARYRTPHVLIYADPPYVLSTRHGKLYQHEMQDADHQHLLDLLDDHPGPVVLSGYRCTLYDERLRDWHRIERPTLAEKGNVRTEVLWLNALASHVLH